MDSNTIIRRGTVIGDDCFISSNCIIGEYKVTTNEVASTTRGALRIGKNSLIRSGTIMYTDSEIGDYYQTGHNALIGAGTVVTKDVAEYKLILGNPGFVKGDVREIKDRSDGSSHYLWRYTFDRAMPWEDCSFDSWHETLPSEYKKHLLD